MNLQFFVGLFVLLQGFAIIPTIGTWKALVIRPLKSRPFVAWNYRLCKKNPPQFGLFNATWFLESRVFQQYCIGGKVNILTICWPKCLISQSTHAHTMFCFLPNFVDFQLNFLEIFVVFFSVCLIDFANYL